MNYYYLHIIISKIKFSDNYRTNIDTMILIGNISICGDAKFALIVINYSAEIFPTGFV